MRRRTGARLPARTIEKLPGGLLRLAAERAQRAIVYALRVAVGVFIIWLILRAAAWTTRDCTVGLYVFDICSWVWVREHLGLPANKLLRAVFLELVGLVLLAGIGVTVRFVMPFWGRKKDEPGE